MKHSHKHFGEELSDLSGKLAEMGLLVLRQIDGAIQALADHDPQMARTIIDRDVNVNRMDIELDEFCLQLLALHQPVARDLRFVTGVMKIATELERIGDRAVNIGEAVHVRGEHDSTASHAEITQMGAFASTMVRDSFLAFSKMDGSVARRVMENDRKFDAVYAGALLRLFAQRSKDPDRIAHDTNVVFLAKDLNEISEHATNIAEVVIFMVDGREIIHMDIHERRAERVAP